MNVASDLLSILIPTRDRPKLLAACLQSVYESQWRIDVIVSDNSTADHPEHEELRARHGFDYVRQSGKLSATDHFNACLELPSSKWIWMLHDDDELYPGGVEKMAARLGEIGDVGLVVGGLHYIDQAGMKHSEWMPKPRGESRGEAGLLAAGVDAGALSPAMVFRADAALEWGGFVEIGGHPADYTFLAGLAHDYGVAFLPEVVGRYRHGSHQETDVSNPGTTRAWLDFTIDMTRHTIAKTKCSANAATQLLDYMTWYTFLTLMPRWLDSHPQFVVETCRDCLIASPARLSWQMQVRETYPMLFLQPGWLAAASCRVASLGTRAQRKIRRVGDALALRNPR
jgi:hypothetical protein